MFIEWFCLQEGSHYFYQGADWGTEHGEEEITERKGVVIE